MIGKLEKLTFWILETDDEDQDAALIDGIPKETKQRLFKDLYVIEILTDILHYVFKNKIMDLENVGETNKKELRIF